MMATVDILLADDHELILSGLRTILGEVEGWRVVGSAKNGREAVRLAADLLPHVVVMDVSMSDLNGIEATRQIRLVSPSTEILILTMHESDRVVCEAFEAGAKGFLLKTDTNLLLTTAVQSLAAHKTFFAGNAADILLQGSSVRCLSSREREILQLIAEGFHGKEIADKLGVSGKTVEAHRSNIMRKLNLHSVAQLVRYAIRQEIISS